MSTSFIRSFSSTTSSLQRTYRFVTQRRIPKAPEVKEGDLKSWDLQVPRDIPKYPVYKYGESHWYKQSNNGLYGGQFPGSGNKVSEEGHKTPRSWKVNVIRKHLWSETLQKSIKLKTTGRVLRTLRKEGGLDNYLLKEKSARIKELGPRGYKLKYDVLMEKQKQLTPKKLVHRIPDAKQGGKLVKVYHIVTYNDVKYKFTVGKRQLMKYLYNELVKQHIERYSWMQFSVEYQPKSVEEIVIAMVDNGVDLSEITI